MKYEQKRRGLNIFLCMDIPRWELNLKCTLPSILTDIMKILSAHSPKIFPDLGTKPAGLRIRLVDTINSSYWPALRFYPSVRDVKRILLECKKP